MMITVLLSTYNGESYLREQLDSLLAQKLPDGGQLEIIVRDDGSKDKTSEILDSYQNEDKLTWYTGKNLRPAKSFWHLLQNCPQSDYYAFCDQDDVWNEDKLMRAIAAISSVEAQDKPILYCSNVNVVDEKLNFIRELTQGQAHTDFAHSLAYSLAPGCTFVFNDKAREELIKYDMENNYVIIHDWLAHKIVAMLGTVIYDKSPSMSYRQHGNNVIGASSTGFKRTLQQLKRFIGSNDCVRSNSAKSILKVYEPLLDDETIDLLKTVGYYREDRKYKKKFIKSKAFCIDSKIDFFFRWLIRLNKV